MEKSRDRLIADLVGIQYERNDINFVRNKFRVRGDVVEIFPANSTDTAIRVEFFGDEIDRITEINVVTGEVLCPSPMPPFSLRHIISSAVIKCTTLSRR